MRGKLDARRDELAILHQQQTCKHELAANRPYNTA